MVDTNYVTPHRVASIEDRVARLEVEQASQRREMDNHKSDLMLVRDEMALLSRKVDEMTASLPAAVGRVVRAEIREALRNLRRVTVWGAPFIGVVLTLVNLWKAFA